MVGYGKHLCGAATDLSLRCLGAALRAPLLPARRAPGPHAPRLRGVAIATCCHHRCDWRHYVGQGWWRGTLGASPVEFETARMLSSWAVDGGGRAPTAAVPAGPDATSASDATGGTSGVPQPPWHGVDRMTLGRQCKRLIDAGRAWYLQQTFGLAPAGAGGTETSAGSAVGSGDASAPAAALGRGSVRLVYYCEASLSPENCLLLASSAAAVSQQWHSQ